MVLFSTTSDIYFIEVNNKTKVVTVVKTSRANGKSEMYTVPEELMTYVRLETAGISDIRDMMNEISKELEAANKQNELNLIR